MTESNPAMVRLLDRALRALGDAGETERACRLAADAYAVLEKSNPLLAERFTGTLHHLTCVPPRPPRQPGAGKAFRL
ncbi:MAG: hypothetical protein ACRENY_04780 [Candidatus Dormibacteria bacterium]